MKRRAFTKLLVGFGAALGLGPRVGAEAVEPENLEQPPPLTKDNIVEYIQEMARVLDEQKAPQQGRWVEVTNPEILRLIK